jgi:sugar lactone lactonase YvrE
MALQVDCVVRGRELLAECPLWDERTGTLWWVDILAPNLKSFKGSVTTYPLPEAMGSFAFRDKEGLVAAMKSGLYFLDPKKGERRQIAQPESDQPHNRFNDGRCDRAGRFWAGTMVAHPPRRPSGALYRLSPTGACARIRPGVIIPNSLAWSPDGRTMYFADTVRELIWSFDYDLQSGDMSNERVFADCAANPGYPDGSCVDADGCLWNAEYGGGRVVRYTPSGKIDRVIELPVQNPTCCCFGGARFDTLYITTAAQELKEKDLEKQPLAGSLLAVNPGSSGLPESRFAGSLNRGIRAPRCWREWT